MESVVGKVKTAIHLISMLITFELFKLKSLFIASEFNIPPVIAFYAFLLQLKIIIPDLNIHAKYVIYDNWYMSACISTRKLSYIC